MKMGAWAFLLLALNTAITIPLAIYALVVVERQLLFATLGFLAFGLVLILLWRLCASGARCSLCMGPIYLHRHCSRNAAAKRSFGSYRLRVARDIILTRSFRCPYCGETTRCETKSSTRSTTDPASPQNPA